MKTICVFFLCFISISLIAERKYGVKHVSLLKSSDATLLFNSYQIVTDDSDYVYISSSFKGTFVLGNDTLHNNYDSTVNNQENAYYISKSDKSTIPIKTIKLLEGRKLHSYTLKYFSNFFYAAISFNDTLFLAQDTIISKGKSDFCILKFDSHFNLVAKRQVGSYNEEGIAANAFTINNGSIYFGANYNGDDNVNSYDNYQLVVDTDTLVCDTDSSNSKGEFFICQMDTDLHVVKIKSMSGRYDNSCSSIDVQAGEIYVLGWPSQQENNIGGLLFNCINFGYNSRFFIAKLDSNLNGKWVRRIGDINWGTMGIRQLFVSDSSVIFTGRVLTGSGCGPAYLNSVKLDNYGTVPTNTGQFSFIGSYNTLGVFKYIKNSDINNDFEGKTIYKNEQTDKLFVTGNGGDGTVIGTDTMKGCLMQDPYVAGFNPATGKYNLIGYVQGNKNESISKIAFSKYNKLFVTGSAKSDEIYAEHDTLFLNWWQTNHYFAAFDSIEFWPLQTSAIESENRMVVYPNPCENEIIFLGPPQSGEGKLEIYNTMGQILYKTHLENGKNTLRLDAIRSGHYVYKMEFQSGKIEYGRFVKIE